MAKPDESEPALPWAPRPLRLGAELEVEIEGGWISAEVAEAHGEHQYTLLVHKPDEDDAPPAQPDADASAAAAAGGEAGAPGRSAAGTAAADEDGAEGEEVLEMRVRIVSDSMLDILDSDGGEPESLRCHWRPAPTSMQEMFSRAFLNLAQRQPLPRGVELPSADQLAAVLAQGLAEVVQRAVTHTKEAGSAVVEVESVHAAMAGMAAELGLPDLGEVRARQDQAQQQAPQAQQAQQEQQSEGGQEAEDGRPVTKKARRSP